MRKLVIANRGEIARRILRAARERGWCVAVISVDSDVDAVVRREADWVLEVSSFLAKTEIVAAAKAWGAHFLHPGYGFLSENAEFANAVEQAGIVFVGPTVENLQKLGSKENAKKCATSCGVPTLASLSSEDFELSKNIEFDLIQKGLVAPYLLKARSGGGGRGLRLVHSISELSEILRTAQNEAQSGFADSAVFIEQFLNKARHIEVQAFGDGKGKVVILGDRECSVQRKYQKVLEEAPAPNLLLKLRADMAEAARKILSVCHYRGAGTVEFVVDSHFYFLEVNTRIQVEHTVTEKVFGIDLIQAQLDLALGRWPAELDIAAQRGPIGAAIEVRLLSEDPRRNFIPTPGTLVRYQEPCVQSVRVDSGVVERSAINPNFDSLVAKIIASGLTREGARLRLIMALEAMIVHGCHTNLDFLSSILTHRDFVAGNVHTTWLEAAVPELTQERIPPRLIALLTSSRFCEQLALALCGGLATANEVFAERFLSIGNSFLRIGSSKEEAPWTIETLNYNGGLFQLSGSAVAQAILAACEPGTHHSSSFKELYAKVTQSADAAKVPFVATRVSESEMAVSCLGETLMVASPRHLARVNTKNPEIQNDVRAPLAGRVTQVCVGAGDRVATGSLLFVLESMKMLFEIRAERDGLMESVLVELGQVLPGPMPLATFAPS